MNDEHEDKSSPERRVLDQLAAEARQATAASDDADRAANLDWERVDAGLFARIEREARKTRALASHRGKPGAWLLLGGAAAAAAAAAMVLAPGSHGGSAAPTALAQSSAGDLALQKGAGTVLVDGARARAGVHVRAGDSVATRGAKAEFEDPGRVTWLLEDETSVTVERSGGVGSPIVLGLRQGAVEAQVVPVSQGEAFAIDVGATRVAVHGTHLRVARNGDRVVVDLTEGVVSIGAPPKSGSTYGALVMAPAHVEFQASALDSSLEVDHTDVAVRKAADLDSLLDGETSASISPPPPTLGPTSYIPPASASKHGAGSAGQSAHPAAVLPVLNTDDDVRAAARECWAKDPYTGVSAVFSTEARFQVQENGSVVGSVFYSNPFGDSRKATGDCLGNGIRAMHFGTAGQRVVKIKLDAR